MNVIEATLADALGHGKDMAALAGKLRDKLKGGVADMQATYDEAVAFVDSSVAKAKEGLVSFKDKVAEIEGEVKDDEAGMPSAAAVETAPIKLPEPAPQPEAPSPSPAVASVVAEVGAPVEHVEPAVDAHAEAIANGSTPEVAHAEAQAAAAQAGAEPEVAVQIADSVATQPAVEAAPVI